VPAVRARAWPAFVAIVAAHAGESIAIVAHGATNRALLCTALGLELHRILALGQDYGALSVLERVAEGWRLARLNEPPMLQCARVLSHHLEWEATCEAEPGRTSSQAARRT